MKATRIETGRCTRCKRPLTARELQASERFCPGCRQWNERTDERIRRQFNPKTTPPLFGEEQPK